MQVCAHDCLPASPACAAPPAQLPVWPPASQLAAALLQSQPQEEETSACGHAACRQRNRSQWRAAKAEAALGLPASQPVLLMPAAQFACNSEVTLSVAYGLLNLSMQASLVGPQHMSRTCRLSPVAMPLCLQYQEGFIDSPGKGLEGQHASLGHRPWAVRTSHDLRCAERGPCRRRVQH